MVNETSLLRYLKIYLGQRFNLESSNFYLDIVNEISIPTFSQYYPSYIRGILITEKDGIVSYNPTTRRNAIVKYKIPVYSQDTVILDIADFYHPMNDRSSSMINMYPGQFSTASFMASAKVLSALPHTNSVYTCLFEPPDFAIIHPTPMSHINFTIDIKVIRPLSQIMPNYREWFFKLCLLDVKIALYNKYINLRNNGTLGGIEVNIALDDFSSAESDREALIEKFIEDAPKQYNNLINAFNKIVY